MGKWYNNVKRVKYSNQRGTDKLETRFLNAFDMAEAKRAEATLNSQIKRGEIPKGNYRTMSVCRCGWSGCIMSHEYTLKDGQIVR